MFNLKNYKILSYTVLAIVIIISFALTNLLLNLIITGKLGAGTIVYIILNLVLNFFMFFLFFKISQLYLEKEAAMQELINQIESSRKQQETNEEIVETVEFDVDKIIEEIIPQAAQNLKMKQFTEKILANIANFTGLVQGVFYVKTETGEFKAAGKYAFYSTEDPKSFFEGESLPGQVAKDKKMVIINNIPEDYFNIVSGLGSSKPKNILIFPILHKEETIGVIELATFKEFDKNFEKVLDKLSLMLSKILIKLK